MKKILALIGSPRKLGNCEIVAKMISGQIKEPHELNLLRISDFNIKLCRGCYMCLIKNKCPLKDDLGLVIDAFAEADAFIVAAPTYCLGANASLKLLADRILFFYSRNAEIWGKPAVGVGVAGIEGKEGSTKLQIDSFMTLFQMQIKASEILYGAMPGEAALEDANKPLISGLANALFNDPVKDSAPGCPLCGGDTFRFYENNRVRCMLCSNEGKVDTSGLFPVFHIGTSSHELLLTQQDALSHGQWLQQMKQKFGEDKTKLKQVTRQYADMGSWIRPLEKTDTGPERRGQRGKNG
ncbi:MAG: flavodoxin family protein [Desulfobacteraceae bacterium]|nr:flavodoxin family protein [Desulfobacteraceae bacterium]